MKKVFPTIFIGVFLLVISACGNTKNNDVKNEIIPPAALQKYSNEGFVQIAEGDEECKLWIMSTTTSSVTGFYPVNLGENFKVHGMRVSFNYEDSRAPLPEGCFNLKAIVIQDIVAL